MTPIPGTTFTKAYTVNRYADGKIQLEDAEGTKYRIDVLELLKLIQGQSWHLVKTTKYQHLVRAK